MPSRTSSSYTTFDPAGIVSVEVQEILDLYSDLRLVEFGRLHGGMANTSFRVSARDDGPEEVYVLTFMDGHTDESAERLVDLLFALGGDEGLCPPPVTTAAGKAVVRWNGHRIMMRPYVHGTVREASALELETLGAAIANFHLTPVESPIIDVESQRRIHERWIVNSLATDLVAGEQLDKFRRVSDPTTWGSWAELPRGLVHGDLLPQNVVWSHDSAGIKPTIIDWDTACRDALILDLAIAVVGHCQTTSRYARHPLSHERFAALVGGYQSVRPLDLTERSILHHVIDFAAAMVAASRISMRVTKAGKPGLPPYRELLAICDPAFDTDLFTDDAVPAHPTSPAWSL